MKLRLFRVSVVLALTVGLLASAPASSADPLVDGNGLSPPRADNTYDKTVTIYGSGFVAGATVDLVELVPGSEEVPGLEQVETVHKAISNGRVSSDGRAIAGIVLPTKHQAPSYEADRPDEDVSWFVRVTNPAPDGKKAFSPEFTITGGVPTISIAATRFPTGKTTTVKATGANLSRRATFSVSETDRAESQYQGTGKITVASSFVEADGVATYELSVTVPADYPAAKYTLTMKNTDQTSATCAGCIDVTKVEPLRVPTIRRLAQTYAENTGDAVVDIHGSRFDDLPDPTTASLIGYCVDAQGTCPLRGHVIAARTNDRTQDNPDQLNAAGRDQTDDVLRSVFDLRLAPPGRYSVQVSNDDGGPATSVRERSFDIAARPPTIDRPSAPYSVTAGEGTSQTLTITGTNFARRDVVSVDGVLSARADGNVRSDALTVSFIPDVAAPSGRYDLRVTHTDGASSTCTSCVQVTNTTPAPERFVAAVYALFSNDPPSMATRKAEAARLTSAADRLTLTRRLSRSDPYAGTEIERLYQVTLGRASDAGGKANWMAQVRAGVRIDVIASKFFGSAEYFARKGGTNKRYVEALYVDILGRPHDDAGRDHWVRQIDSGAKNRVQVAAGFYGSSESRAKRASRLYVNVFRVAPTSTQLAPWATMVGQLGDLEVAAQMAATREFYKLATGVFP